MTEPRTDGPWRVWWAGGVLARELLPILTTMPDLKITRREINDHMISGVRVTETTYQAMRARLDELRCGLSEYVRALIEADLAAQSATQKRSARV